MEERDRPGRGREGWREQEEFTEESDAPTSKAGSPLMNIPFKGVAGWIISLLLALVIFFFWQNKEANERIMLAEVKRADKAELNANFWRDKYFNCNENMNTLGEIYKQFGVNAGKKTMSIVPLDNQEEVTNEQ